MFQTFAPVMVFVAGTLLAGQAVATQWALNKENSQLEFRFAQGNAETSGQFEEFDATISFDPDDLSSASVEATIVIGSFSTGNGQIDDAVAGADWFLTSQFPQAVFQSQSFEAKGDNLYQVSGELTIRDQTVPVTLEGSIEIAGDRATAELTTNLDRIQFGVGQGSFANPDQIAHEVPVTIKIEANRNQ